MFDHLGVRLPRRRREVLTHLVTGMTNKEIAKALGISPRSVKMHLRLIFAETRTQNRTELVMRALNYRTPETLDHPALAANPSLRRTAQNVIAGFNNKQIARIQNTTEQVIKNNLRQIYDVYGVWSRLELAVMLGVPRVSKETVRNEGDGVGEVGSDRISLEQEAKGRVNTVRLSNMQRGRADHMASGA